VSTEAAPAVEPVDTTALVETAMRSLRPASWRFRIAIAVLSVIVTVGLVAWVVQLRQGMGVAGYSDRSFWAIYIADVVAFIGFSYGGAVVSAILLLTGAHWRAPLARLAEGMALVTVAIGAAFVIPHLGRPDRLIGMLTQPNVASPVFWDLVAILTYSFVTLIFFLLPLVPDTAILRGAHPDEMGGARLKLYRLISRDWSGSGNQRRVLRSALLVVAIVIIPLAVSVHSVLAWAFALVSRPGWHESIWAPYFVIAALYSGVALVIIVVAAFRRGYGLEHFITDTHIVRLGYLMATLGSIYLYLTFADLLPSAYVGEEGATEIIHGMLVGEVAPWFWLFVVAGMILPILFVALPWTRKPVFQVVSATLVVIAMWIKRVIMVVETAGYDQLSGTFGEMFHFTWVSASITLAGAAAIPLLLMLIFRVVPLLAIDEIAEVAGAPITPAPTQGSAAASRHPTAIVGAGLLLAALAGAAILTAPPAQADDLVTEPAVMSLTATAEGPQVSVTATLTQAGQPVSGAPVTFYQSTTMFAPGTNKVPMGKAMTGPDGVASASYFSTEQGQMEVSATYYAAIDAEPVTAQTSVDVTQGVDAYRPPTPKLLAPVGQVLVKSIFVLVVIVIVLVIAQLVRVRRVTRPGAGGAVG